MEGELKNRLFAELYRQDGTIIDGSVDEKPINNIIDEAKQDFPDSDKLFETPEGKKAYQDSEYDEMFWELYLTKIEDWFKKWFGDDDHEESVV